MGTGLRLDRETHTARAEKFFTGRIDDQAKARTGAIKLEVPRQVDIS